MFNSVEYVRRLCKEKGTTVSALEKACGFANGYLNPKKMSKLPYDRALAIANYLNVSVEEVLTGKENNKAPTDEGERKISDKELKFALWGSTDIDDDDLDDVRRYAAFIRERKKKK